MKQDTLKKLGPPFYYPGLRRLRVGEIIEKGDVRPDLCGQTQPVSDGAIGWPVLGKRDGEDFVFRLRKRKEPNKRV